MKIDDLPFLHFLIRVGSGLDSGLVSPLEAEADMAPGGLFVAPLDDEGHLFPTYRFHFSIYLGSGQFQTRGQGRGKALFLGLAVAARMDRRSRLLLTFDFPGPEAEKAPGLPRVLRIGDEYLIPILQRVPRKAPLPYAGTFQHRDFEHPLAELEPADPEMLDQLLEIHGISLIGCDPHTAYERARV